MAASDTPPVSINNRPDALPEPGLRGFYNDKVVRQFAVMTVVWGIVGMAVGVLIAAQLYWPALNFDTAWLSYGRLRPLHTNAVIFAFGGSALFATSLYVVQRTCHVRLISDRLAAFVFWGWQAVILAAAITLPLGITQGKEYAELEWPIDILITIVWVAYGWLFFGTIAKRKVKHIYVANWFYGAYIIAIALLHIVNNLVIPVGATKSYSVYSGAVDAMVQWWYGHNAVGFLLTAGFLGMMYYFVPKQAGRPVYSYRLSIVHFWALIAVYMWAGPHHLHYTALPDWVQSVGMVFSLILLAPSWGGALNGILTLSGVWHKLRTDPILKFLIVAISFYMIATFEGPMMSIKTVNSLSHYTDWNVGHVHAGALGWVAMISIGSIYALTPRLLGLKAMYSTKWIDAHFWVHTLGVVFYIASMWIAGVMQGLMWRATNADGTLTYSFVEALNATYPYYLVRLGGGVLVLAGMVLMAVNTWKTYQMAVAVSFGGLAEIVPLMYQAEAIQPLPGVKPYPALQLAGRDIYVREGCYNCHSQMVRTLRFETERYGHYSLAGESVYDRPFQWGSKRTGPDLARVGGRYSDDWHRVHLNNPRDVVPESNMPNFPWLARTIVDGDQITAHMRGLKRLGDPYTDADLAGASAAVAGKTELDAVVAYLQALGKHAPRGG